VEKRHLIVLASLGLAVGGVLGLAGAFVPTASMRGLAWGIDGTALVVASVLLAVHFLRQGSDLVAAGFLVFAIGQGLLTSGAAMDLARSTPSFGTGAGLWAAGLVLISAPAVFPAAVRGLGLVAAALLAATALQIYAGSGIDPKSSPLPYFAYPFLVATFAGWIWALLFRRLADTRSI
jgi:hypothetical protein